MDMREEVERITSLIEKSYEEVVEQLKCMDVPDLHAYLMERLTGAKHYAEELAEYVGEAEAKRILYEKFETAFKKLCEKKFPLETRS